MEVTAPYVFVSYAHADSDRVTPFVNGLKKRGVNIWLDKDHIPPTGEFVDEIAEAIYGCCCMIPFLSAGYQSSNVCKQELKYGFDEGKPIIPVMLENVNLIPAVKFTISGVTPLRKLSYDSTEKLLDVLVSDNDIKKCILQNLPFESNESIAIHTARWLMAHQMKELSFGIYRYLAFESKYAEAQFELVNLCLKERNGDSFDLEEEDIITLLDSAVRQGHNGAAQLIGYLFTEMYKQYGSRIIGLLGRSDGNTPGSDSADNSGYDQPIQFIKVRNK